MSISNRRVLLLSLMLIPTTAFATVLELESLDLVVVYTNCACYPGITTWGYVLQALAAFVFLDSALLLLWFWRIIAGPAMWLLALVDFIAYVSAFFPAAGVFQLRIQLPTIHLSSQYPCSFCLVRGISSRDLLAPINHTRLAKQLSRRNIDPPWFQHSNS
jgi:hypothetical protein